MFLSFLSLSLLHNYSSHIHSTTKISRLVILLLDPFDHFVSFTLISTIEMTKTLNLISFNDNNINLQKDDYSSHSFARGFDDFVVTWPPSNNTTNINDDK